MTTDEASSENSEPDASQRVKYQRVKYQRAESQHVEPQPIQSEPVQSEPVAAQPNNPLHGITLLKMLEHLVEVYGWEELGFRIDIRCFTHDPSMKSSLKFLRKTDWARAKVERLYLRSLRYNHGRAAAVEDDKNSDETSP